MHAAFNSKDRQRYPRALQVIHWCLTALVTIQFTLILIFHQIKSLELGQIVLGMHRQCGLLILILVLVRFVLAFRIKRPRSMETVPPWQRRTAGLVHLALLVMLAVQPLLGLLVASSRGDTVFLLGLVKIPALARLTTEQGVSIEIGHRWLAFGLLGLLAIHLGAVAFNRLLRKDRVIERMLPKVRSDRLANRVPVFAQLCFCCGAILSLTLAAGLYGAHQYAVSNELRAQFEETDVTILDEMRTAQVPVEALPVDPAPATTAAAAASMVHDFAPRLVDPAARAGAVSAALALNRIAAGDKAPQTIAAARGALQDAVDSQAMKVFQRGLELRQIAEKGHDVIVLALAPTVLISAVLAFLLSSSILHALATTRNVVQHVERGEVDDDITVRGSGEFAALMRDIIRMRGAVEMRQRESQRREMEIADRAAAEQLRAAAEQAEILRAKAAADSASQAKSDFLANMSHELRTPLNAILGYAQLLNRDASLDQRQLNAVNTIHQSGAHLLMLINDILDLSKIEAGKFELVPASVDLRAFLNGIAAIIRVRTEEKALEFICEMPPDLPDVVQADEKRLRQVLINLLGNAVKFTDKGKVSLRVSLLSLGQADARIGFEVSDTGVGIAEDQLATIFQPFEQVGDMHRRMSGTGLGLSISRKLIELMKSRIEVESRPGEGSRFWFELDMPIERLKPAAPPVTVAATGYRGPRRSILIVDDIAENRTMLADMLGELGFETPLASNGLEGLELAAALRPDLILMDVRMPVMDGLEATRRIREMENLAALPIVAVSAGVTPEDQANSLAAGANAFLVKPVERDGLLRTLSGHLQLDWVQEDADPPAPSVAASAPITLPSQAEIEVLHRLAMAGNMRDIRSRAEYLVSMDTRHRPFADMLQQLAQSYKSQAILDLIEKHLHEGAEAERSVPLDDLSA